jgi:hypothetical protein
MWTLQLPSFKTAAWVWRLTPNTWWTSVSAWIQRTSSLVNSRSVKTTMYVILLPQVFFPSLFDTSRNNNATPIVVVGLHCAGDSTSAHWKERRWPRPEPLPAGSAHPTTARSKASELQDQDQGSMICCACSSQLDTFVWSWCNCICTWGELDRIWFVVGSHISCFWLFSHLFFFPSCSPICKGLPCHVRICDCDYRICSVDILSFSYSAGGRWNLQQNARVLFINL